MKIKNYIVLIISVILIILFGFLCSSKEKISPVAHEGVLDLEKWNFEQDGIVKLDGEWELYWNQLLSSEDFKNNDTKNPDYINIPSTLKGKIIDGKKLGDYGYCTLRMKVKVNYNDKVYGLKTQNILSSCKVFINGDLTAQHGIVGEVEEKYSPIFLSTQSFFKSDSNEVEIIIQTANFREPSSKLKTMYFGTKDQVVLKSIKQLAFDLILFGSIFIMAMYHFGLYFLRKKNKSSLYFALFCCCIAVRQLFVGERLLVQIYPNMPFELLSKNAAITYYLAVPFFLLYLKELFPEISTIVVKISLFSGIAISSICLVTTNKIYDRFTVPYQFLTILLIVYVFHILINAFINKKAEAIIVILGFMAIAVAAVCDMLCYDNFIRVDFMMPTGVFIFIFSQSYLLAVKFSKAFSDVEELASENSIMYHEILELNKCLGEKVEERTKELKNSTYYIKNLLDNAGQGFLSFGQDLMLHEECSLECYKIFNNKIQGKKFTDIVYKNNSEDKKLMDNILKDVISEKNDYKNELLLGLLPEEVNIDEKVVHMNFKIIQDTKEKGKNIIMVVLTDITDKRQLENQIEHERNILKMVVKAVVNYNDFLDNVNSYREFCDSVLYTKLNSNEDVNEIYSELLRNIHTFKGNFSQLDMINMVYKLHNLEDKLILLNNKDTLNVDILKEFFSNYNLCDWIDEDLNKLQEILGKEYFHNESKIILDKSSIIEIEKKAAQILKEDEYEKIIGELKKLRYRSFKDMLKSYEEYTYNLAINIDKFIQPFKIEGDDIKVDDKKYLGVTKSIVHVFRNIIYHGIESLDERIEKGKQEYGIVKCKIKIIDNNIVLNISDDGRGLNIKKIKDKALKMHLFSKDEIEKMTEEEIVNIIFMDCFSTNDNSDLISGRGVGLSAVYNEVKKIGGKIQVITQPDIGTTFKVILPIER